MMDDLTPVEKSQVPEGACAVLTWYTNPKKNHHDYNIRWMRPLMTELMQHHGVVFWHPAVDAAPWHMQCRINGYLVNVWPCAGKAQVDGEKGRQGQREVYALFMNVLGREPEPNFDPLDDGDDFDVCD